MTQKIIVTIGISGSGKSTWASKFIEENSNWYRVNRDSLRMMVTGTDSRFLDRTSESLITKMQYECVKTLLLEDKNVIIDNTHLNFKYIDQIKLAFGHLAEIEFKFFHVDVDKAVANVRIRDGVPNPDYIFKQQEQYINLKRRLVFGHPESITHPQTQETYVNPKGEKICIICDLDGTLSLFEDKSPYERDFENDELNFPVGFSLINFVQASDEHHIFFFSGRSNKFRKQTEEFLSQLELNSTEYTLVMRGEEDIRRDSLVKMEMFNNHIRDIYAVFCVYDDRLQVIEECWNKLGLNVLNCNQLNKRF